MSNINEKELQRAIDFVEDIEFEKEDTPLLLYQYKNEFRQRILNKIGGYIRTHPHVDWEDVLELE